MYLKRIYLKRKLPKKVVTKTGLNTKNTLMWVCSWFSTSRRCAEHKKHTHMCFRCSARRGLPVLYCAPPVPIGTGRTGVGEGFEGWGRARKCQKHTPMAVFLAFSGSPPPLKPFPHPSPTGSNRNQWGTVVPVALNT